MQRRVKLSFHRMMRQMQARGDKALHVGAAAAQQIAAARGQLERIAAPVLPFHWHHIRMPGKRHTLRIGRPNGGPEIGLPAILIVNKRGGNPERLKLRRNEINQRQVAAAADRWASASMPERVDNEETKVKLQQLRDAASAFDELVKSGDPQEIGNSLTELHDLFHELQEEWYGAAGGHEEHH